MADSPNSSSIKVLKAFWKYFRACNSNQATLSGAYLRAQPGKGSFHEVAYTVVKVLRAQWERAKELNL